MINELKVGDKVVVVKENPNHWNFKDFMEEFLGGTLTVSYIDSNYGYVKVDENYYSWDERFIDWEATSKLNNPSKLYANIKLDDYNVENLVSEYKKVIVNPFVQIKNAIEGQPFKYEYYSEGSFCVSLYESEVPICYYKGELHLDTEICSTNLDRGMIEEIAKVMKIVEDNLDLFLMKEE